MISRALKAVFGSRNDRLLKQYSRTVRDINALEPAIKALSDEQLAAKTAEFRARIAKRLEGVPEEAVLDTEKASQIPATAEAAAS